MRYPSLAVAAATEPGLSSENLEGIGRKCTASDWVRTMYTSGPGAIWSSEATGRSEGSWSRSSRVVLYLLHCGGQSGGKHSDLRRTVHDGLTVPDFSFFLFFSFDGSSKFLLEGDQKVRRRLGVGRPANLGKVEGRGLKF